MAFGPGKYDYIATEARKLAGLGPEDGGGAIVIIVGGNKGNGFACQTDAATLLTLPDMLEFMAKQIRASEGIA
jgi:hypothetical protein